MSTKQATKQGAPAGAPAVLSRETLAGRAAVALSLALEGARDAGAASIASTYGAGVTQGTVTVARNVALTIAKDDKAPKQGAARQAVLKALRVLADLDKGAPAGEPLTISPAVLVEVATLAKSRETAAAKALRDEETAARATAADPAVSSETAAAAHQKLASIAKQKEDKKRAAAESAFSKALLRAVETLGIAYCLDSVTALSASLSDKADK